MMTKSQELFQRGRKVIPGGVNSPVRAFGSVGLTPRFISRGEGPYLYDVDGNRYLDYVGSWGPMILGHNHPIIRDAVEKAAKDGLSFGAPCPAEVRMAELITRLTGVEMVRMVSSGTEAAMTAVRLARGYTGRDIVIKFEGCYHGHSDSMLVKAGSGALTGGVPSSAGVPGAVAADTLTASFNDLDSVRRLLEAHPDEVAAIIVEPVAANMGLVLPEADFLTKLRELCHQYGALLILDEVITGFRLGIGGAQERFGVQGDLVIYGKIIGGGMPVGACGGRREVMEKLAPLGSVYQAGTLSGNPVAMAAGLAQLQLLEQNAKIYTQMEQNAQLLTRGLSEAAAEVGIAMTVNHIGSLSCAFFTEGTVKRYSDAVQSDTKRYAAFFANMLERGVYLAPAQFEAIFVSAAHTTEQIEWTVEMARQTMQDLTERGV